ncbi:MULTISPECIES: rubrerythrin-like domain-containing protein [Halostella]|nr:MULTISPECIES: rubrerythrin-like domain-containing protein [Halostella]
MDRDVESDPEAESTYECLGCGHMATETNHPTDCPECGDTMRNRGTPFE